MSLPNLTIDITINLPVGDPVLRSHAYVLRRVTRASAAGTPAGSVFRVSGILRRLVGPGRLLVRTAAMYAHAILP